MSTCTITLRGAIALIPNGKNPLHVLLVHAPKARRATSADANRQEYIPPHVPCLVFGYDDGWKTKVDGIDEPHDSTMDAKVVFARDAGARTRRALVYLDHEHITFGGDIKDAGLNLQAAKVAVVSGKVLTDYLDASKYFDAIAARLLFEQGTVMDGNEAKGDWHLRYPDSVDPNARYDKYSIDVRVKIEFDGAFTLTSTSHQSGYTMTYTQKTKADAIELGFVNLEMPSIVGVPPTQKASKDPDRDFELLYGLCGKIDALNVPHPRDAIGTALSSLATADSAQFFANSGDAARCMLGRLSL